MAAAIDGLLQRHRGVAATTLGYQASSALYTGELQRARALAEQAVRVAEPLGDYLRVGSTRGVLALVYALCGELDTALRIVQPVLRLVEGAESDAFVPGLGQTMGALLLRRGEAAQAAAWFGRETRATDREQQTWLAVQALPGLGAALAACGQTEEAARVLDEAMRQARRFDMPRVLADAFEQQAYLARDVDDAVDLHHEALALRFKHGLRTFSLDSLDALAVLTDSVRVLAATSHARESLGVPRPAIAQQAFESALTRLRASLGEAAFAQAWQEGERLTLEDSIAYIRRTRGTRRRPSTGWASLTPTELEVVRLVVDGLNNPEIGSRLFMSRGTVKTHLGHMYAKLGVANRTELAALASSHLARS
jgi:DNA-binding CsgD family transcriptional regulator